MTQPAKRLYRVLLEDERNEYDTTVHADDFVEAAQKATEYVKANNHPRGFLRLVQVARKDQ